MTVPTLAAILPRGIEPDRAGRRRTGRRLAGAVAGLTVGVAAMASAAPLRGVAGPTPPPLTPAGWSLTPAGRQLTLDDLPLNGVLTPDSRFLIISNDGQGSTEPQTQSLQVVDRAAGRVIQTIPFAAPEALYLGLGLSPDGRTLYASAGGNNKLRVFDVVNGVLTASGSLPMTAAPDPGNPYPAGLAVDGSAVYVADNLGGGVSKLDRASGRVTAFTPTGAAGPGCSTVYNGQSPLACPYPYSVALSRDGNLLFVTNSGEDTVSVLDTAGLALLRTLPVGLHPGALAVSPADGSVFVAASDSDAVSVLDAHGDSVLRTIPVRADPSARDGSQPDALALSPDGGTLYVAESGLNAVAVVDLHEGGGRVSGLIPTAWYPSAVIVPADGSQLLVLNAKGLGAGPNPAYRQGTYGPADQYAGSMMLGTLSIMDRPSGGDLAAATRQVRTNDHLDGGGPRPAPNPIPRGPGEPSPIKHVIFVIKENRTYDQVFGDLGRGNGDPGLAMFGASVTPNLHRLARQFVTLDNFRADAEISAQGHNWVTAARSNDYTEKNWPADYSDRARGYDFEGTNTATHPRAGFLWDDATRAGVSFRDYGEFEHFNGTSWVPNDPRIGSRYCPSCPGYSFRYTDGYRVDQWNQEFQGYVRDGNLPQLEVMRLPNDHTQGSRPGAPTPAAYVAENDQAVGRLVETVSASPYWRDTAIFITEDDAQDGPDHVDAHRTESLVVSPYTQHGSVDSTRYDTASMLHAMELILGMEPLSQFDAAADPMSNAFAGRPDFTPFHTSAPATPTDALNPATGPGASASSHMDFSQEDRAPEDQLNRILWNSTMGPRPYPADRGPRSAPVDEADQAGH